MRREARRERPAFSPELHSQIVNALDAADSVALPEATSPRWRSSAIWWSAAAAILVATSAVVTVWPTGQAIDSQIADTSAEPAAVAGLVEPSNRDGTDAAQIALNADATTLSDKTAGDASPLELYELAMTQFAVVDRAESALKAQLWDQQLAMLDHDARLAASWVLDPLGPTLSDE